MNSKTRNLFTVTSFLFALTAAGYAANPKTAKPEEQVIPTTELSNTVCATCKGEIESESPTFKIDLLVEREMILQDGSVVSEYLFQDGQRVVGEIDTNKPWCKAVGDNLTNERGLQFVDFPVQPKQRLLLSFVSREPDQKISAERPKSRTAKPSQQTSSGFAFKMKFRGFMQKVPADVVEDPVYGEVTQEKLEEEQTPNFLVILNCYKLPLRPTFYEINAVLDPAYIKIDDHVDVPRLSSDEIKRRRKARAISRTDTAKKVVVEATVSPEDNKYKLPGVLFAADAVPSILRINDFVIFDKSLGEIDVDRKKRYSGLIFESGQVVGQYVDGSISVSNPGSKAPQCVLVPRTWYSEKDAAPNSVLMREGAYRVSDILTGNQTATAQAFPIGFTLSAIQDKYVTELDISCRNVKKLSDIESAFKDSMRFYRNKIENKRFQKQN